MILYSLNNSFLVQSFVSVLSTTSFKICSCPPLASVYPWDRAHSPLISTHKEKFQEQRNIPIHSTIPRCWAFFQSQFKLSEKRENITIENHMTTTGELPRSRSLLITFEGTVKHLCSTLPQKLEILTSKIMTRGYPAGQQHQYYKISFLST